MTPSGPFHHQSVIVSGGTSGIGRCCVDRLAGQGARVVAIGKPGDDEIDRTDGHRENVALLHADLTDPASVASVIRESLGLLGGRVDAVVHTVGGSARSLGDGPLVECSVEGWHAALRLNLDSAFLVLKATVAQMCTQSPDAYGQRGRVALVGSVLADHPSVTHFSTIGYAVAKAGLEAMVRHAAAAHARDGVRVNLLKPGLVDTPMAARAVQNLEIRAFLRAKQPLTAGPIAPEACANAILALIDPRSAGLTGSILTFDGGWCVTDPIGGSP